MKLYDSFLNKNNSLKNQQDKNSKRNSSRVHHKKKKLDTESFLNISRKNNRDETVLSNSIILSVISNFIDNKSDNKIIRKPKDKMKTQRKESGNLKKVSGITKSSKTLLNDNNNNISHNISNININNSILKNNNSILLANENKIQMKKKVIKKKSLEVRTAKEILEKKANKESNNNQYKIEMGKIKNPKRTSTSNQMSFKNKKFKETVIGNRKPSIEDNTIKNRKSIKNFRKSNLLKLNNITKGRRSSFLPNFNLKSSKTNNFLTIEKDNNDANPNEIMAILAFREIHKKLKNNIGNNIKDKLYDYENNDITDAINKLPSIKQNSKILSNTEKSITLDNISREINGNLNISKHYEENKVKDNLTKNNDEAEDKEKNRIFVLKGNVYDSLDDEEIIEEIVDNLFFTPDSHFLYIFDFIIMISSFIILLYFPLYLAKNNSINDSIFNFNNILFYFIDFIYLLDLVLEFFRAFYNFDEILIRDSHEIFKHYINSWFLFDLITSVPVFSLITIIQNHYIEKSNYMFSYYYNTNINNLHFLFAFFKVIKIFKVFNSNISFLKLGKIINENEFINDWGNVFLFLFFFISSINFSACLFIFVGRNTYHSWIINFHFDNDNFWKIYIAAIYYIIVTITTVGYGDLVGNSLIEIIFQAIILIAGTCIYSWLISSTSSYIKKMSDINIHYENKLKILEEIRISNPNFTQDLYEKIIRLLNYRKYYEEIDKQIILESLPYSLRNSLIIEMYKPFINNFIFFKNIKNRDFIVQVVSKLKPALSVKGDILIQEGDFIEDIVFVKDGILSLEIKINMDYPDKSIEEYLNSHELISGNNQKSKKRNLNEQTMNLHRDVEIKSSQLFKSKLLEAYQDSSISTNIMQHLKRIKANLETENNTFIKIINLRKNEHFGDVFMFLNNRCPLYLKVRTKKAELLLLKKLDAVSISTTYPRIWKKIIAKSLINTKKIKNLTLKTLVIFCNFHGIKTKFFKQKKYSVYDLKNIIPDNIYNSNFNLSRKSLPLNSEIIQSLQDIQSYDSDESSDSYNYDQNGEIDKKKIQTIIYEEQDEDSYSDESLKNKSQNKNLRNKNKSVEKHSKFKSKENLNNCNNIKLSGTPKENLGNFNINKNNEESSKKTDKQFNSFSSNSKKNNSLSIDSEKINSSSFINNNQNSSDLSNSDGEYSKKIDNKISNDNLKNASIKSIKDLNTNNININDEINEEIYPGENFNIENIIHNKIKYKNEFKNYYPEKIYIKHLNIFENNYLGEIIQNKNKEKHTGDEKNNKSHSEEKKHCFKVLDISSESTMEINSSYENINELTNYSYISDEELRNKTKQFLFKQCGKYHSETNLKKVKFNTNNLDRKSISSNGIINLRKNKSLKSKRKKHSLKPFKSFKVDKSPDFRMSMIKEFNTLRKINNTFSENKIHKSKIAHKRTKNKKEMVKISKNIRQNSQNLQNPELFYTGLFNNIIEKQKKTEKKISTKSPTASSKSRQKNKFSAKKIKK